MAKTRPSLQDILDNADALAKRFEAAEPDKLDWTPTDPLVRVADAVQTRATAERDLLEAVQAARRGGATWADLGKVLGTSGEAARQKYGRVPQQSDRSAPGASGRDIAKVKSRSTGRSRKATVKGALGGTSAVKGAVTKVGKDAGGELGRRARAKN